MCFEGSEHVVILEKIENFLASQMPVEPMLSM